MRDSFTNRDIAIELANRQIEPSYSLSDKKALSLYNNLDEDIKVIILEEIATSQISYINDSIKNNIPVATLYHIGSFNYLIGKEIAKKELNQIASELYNDEYKNLTIDKRKEVKSLAKPNISTKYNQFKDDYKHNNNKIVINSVRHLK